MIRGIGPRAGYSFLKALKQWGQEVRMVRTLWEAKTAWLCRASSCHKPSSPSRRAGSPVQRSLHPRTRYESLRWLRMATIARATSRPARSKAPAQPTQYSSSAASFGLATETLSPLAHSRRAELGRPKGLNFCVVASRASAAEPRRALSATRPRRSVTILSTMWILMGQAWSQALQAMHDQRAASSIWTDKGVSG